MIALTLLVPALLSAPAAEAQTFDEAEAAYKRGDYAAAFESFRALAEQGHARAQFALGIMYAKGDGMRRDEAEAVRWYRRAAEQDHAEGQVGLGMMYDQGYGVPQDYMTAVRWYRRAAEQGHAEGQIRLGLMYGQGNGVSQDYVHAHKWFNIAASRFSSFDQELRALTAQVRNKVAAKMTPAQIAEAQRLAREWKPGQ